jgi:hypothetical protein
MQVHFNAEWSGPNQGTFAYGVQKPNNGVSAYLFPEGGIIRAIHWQSTGKIIPHSILSALVLDTGRSQEALLRGYNGRQHDFSDVIKDVHNLAIKIDPGALIWIGGESNGPHALEHQTTLIIDTNVAVPKP